MKAIPTILLAASLSVTNVQAEPLVDATNPQKLVQLMRGFGSATLEQDGYGDPLITGRINGRKYGIYFYGCEENRNCNDVQFSAAWSGIDVSMQRINEWNQTNRYGKAYLDNDGDPNIEMIVNLKYGVSNDNFDDSIDWWMLTMKEFEQYINTEN